MLVLWHGKWGREAGPGHPNSWTPQIQKFASGDVPGLFPESAFGPVSYRPESRDELRTNLENSQFWSSQWSCVGGLCSRSLYSPRFIAISGQTNSMLVGSSVKAGLCQDRDVDSDLKESELDSRTLIQRSKIRDKDKNARQRLV